MISVGSYWPDGYLISTVILQVANFGFYFGFLSSNFTPKIKANNRNMNTLSIHNKNVVCVMPIRAYKINIDNK